MGRMHDALRKAEQDRKEKRKRDEEALHSADPVKKLVDTTKTQKASLDEKSIERVSSDLALKTDKTLGMPEVDGDSPQPSRPGILGALKAVARPIAISGNLTPGNQLLAIHRPNDYRVEQFRAVRSNLQALEPVPQVIAFTSSVEDEGSSLVAANLACVFAEERGTEILIVDANLRNAELHEIIGIDPNRPGLSEVLSATMDPLDVIFASVIPHVSYVGAGRMTENPGGLLPSRRMTEAMASWREKFDYILVDTPAILGVNDAAVVGHHVDGMVLVLKLGSTPRDLADTAISGLRGAGVRLLGCVLTNAEPGSSPHEAR
ncbi:MAG: CpsD/CapB family tyrosine-protein kinase [Planctomycetota bacterium]